jgi:hypothetical protein
MSDQPAPDPNIEKIAKTGKNPSALEAAQAKALDKRVEQIRGKWLEPRQSTTVELDGKKIVLPNNPVNWQANNRRIATPRDQIPHGTEYLTPQGKSLSDAFGHISNAQLVKSLAPVKDAAYDNPYFGWWFRGSAALAGGVGEALNAGWKWAQNPIGYAYQASFDPELRSAEAINTVINRGYINDRNALTPVQKKALAAWDASQNTYATILALPATNVIGSAVEATAAWLDAVAVIGVKAWHGAFGEELNAREKQDIQDALAYETKLMRDHAPPDIREGVGLGAETKRLIKIEGQRFATQIIGASFRRSVELSGMRWEDYKAQVLDGHEPPKGTFANEFWNAVLNGEFNPPAQGDANQRMASYMTALLNGSQMGKFWGLPQLVKQRMAIMGGEDPNVVKASWYEQQGVAAIQSQMGETLGAIAFDPLNAVLPYIQPVEWLRMRRLTSIMKRVDPELVTEVSRMAEYADELGKAGEGSIIGGHFEVAADGTAKWIDEAATLTVDGQKGRDLAEVANDLVDAAEKTGLQDFIDQSKKVRDLVASGRATAEDVGKAMEPMKDRLAKFWELSQMSTTERMIARVAGNDPFHPETGRGKLLGFLPQSWNPFALSSASKGDNLLNRMYGQFATMLKGAGDNITEMYAITKRGAAGAFGDRWGHMFVSPVGRTLQATLKRVAGHADELFNTWSITTPLRMDGEVMARFLGTDLVDLVGRLQKGGKEAQAVMDAVTDAARAAAQAGDRGAADLLLRIEQGDITTQRLLTIGETFRSTPEQIIPYTADLFRTALLKSMADETTEMAKLMFNIKEARMIEKGFQYVKAAESLILLGLNPKYPVQNFFNNEITAIAHGVFSLAVPARIASKIPVVGRFIPTLESVADDFGIALPRLSEGYGVVGPNVIEDIARGTAGAAEEAGLKGARASLRTTVWGTPGRVGQYIAKASHALPDFRNVSAALERLASERATIASLQKAWPKVWKPGLGYDTLDIFSPGLNERLMAFDNQLPDVLHGWIRSARKPGDIEAMRFAENLNLNPESLLRDVEHNLGIPEGTLGEVGGHDIVESMRSILRELGPKPTEDEIRGAFSQIHQVTQAHIDELLKAQYPHMLEEWAAKIESEGPMGLVGVYGEIADSVYARQVAHANMYDLRVALINEAEDPVLRNRMWTALKSDASQAWERTWNIEQSARRAIARGLQARGIDVGPGFLEAFGTLKAETRSFFNLRDKLWEKHFNDLIGGKFEDAADRVAAAAEVYQKIDEAYAKLIGTTLDAHATMDNLFLTALPGANTAELAAAREWRQMLLGMRQDDMVAMAEFQRTLRGLPREEKALAWRNYNQQRLMLQAQVTRLEQYGRLMLQGDPGALEYFLQQALIRKGQPARTFSEATQRVFERAAHQGQRAEDIAAMKPWQRVEGYLSRHGLASGETSKLSTQLRDGNITLDQYRDGIMEAIGRTVPAPGVTDPEQRLKAILTQIEGVQDPSQLPAEERLRQMLLGRSPEDNMRSQIFGVQPGAGQMSAAEEAAQQAAVAAQTDARAAADLEVLIYSRVRPRVVGPPTGEPKLGIDFDQQVGRQFYVGRGADDLWTSEGANIVTEMEQAAVRRASAPSTSLQHLPADLRQELDGYLQKVTGQLQDSRLMAQNMAEAGRDAALLNYAARTNLDNWMSVVFPFQFWMTHSIFHWALLTLDKPQILTTYAKIRQFLMNAVGPESHAPSRLRGKIHFTMPFAPREFQDIYVDPLRSLGLPFEQFAYPFQQLTQANSTLEGRAASSLRDLLDSGEITQLEYQKALDARSGPIWDRAVGLARADDASLDFNLTDFMNLTASPHLPLQWAQQALGLTQEQSQPLPITRTAHAMLGLGAMLGVDVGKYESSWANTRKQLGLPAFDQWYDYRIDRELSNMIAEGATVDGKPVTPDAVERAMITRSGPVFDAAKERTLKIEGARWAASTLGLPSDFYPLGEQKQRALYDQFQAAMQLGDRGDTRAVNQFFDNHPEFEARMALWKKPEDRLQQFLVDNLWSRWHSLAKVNQDEAKDQLGPLFQRAFLNKDTRSIESIPTDQLAVWLKLLGGDPPMTVHYDAENYPLDLTDPQTAQRVQVYYNTRDQIFHYYDRVAPLWDEYFKLKKGKARSQFFDQNPILGDYTKWRDEFMLRNPDLMQYIDDNPDTQPKFPSQGAYEQAAAQQPNYTWPEWTATVGRSASDLVLDAIVNNTATSRTVGHRLDLVAEQLGIRDGEVILPMMAKAAYDAGLISPAEYRDYTDTWQ